MNERHCMQALHTLFAFQKEGKSNMPTDQILSHPGFEKICRNIKKYFGVIQLNDAVDCLKVLNYMKVPSTSTIVQILLQIIRKNINSLSIPQILFLDYLLQDFESTPLSEALKIALPLVFDLNVTLKLNESKPEQLAACLEYAVKHRLSENTINVLINMLNNYNGEFDSFTARKIIISICRLPRNMAFENLIKKAATDLVVDIDNVPIVKIEVVLNKLAHRFSQSYKFYYQEVMFDTCANYVIDHNIGYKRALALLRNMARVNHVHKPLLDYVSTYIYNNPDTPRVPVDIYSMVVSLVLTDYKPPHWEHLKQWIKSAKDLAQENSIQILWIRFAAALCVLDIYKIDVLTRVLNREYMTHLIEKAFRSNYENYFVIWQCLTTHKPDLVELLPSNLDPKDLVKKMPISSDFPLQGALEAGLGGEQFIMTNMFSKLGVHIDHAIVFNHSSPVYIENKVEYVEDIKLENSQQLLLIVGLTDMDYTINTKELRAIISTTLNILEKTLNCHVLPIHLENWKEFAEFERIPYIVQKIKDKLGLDSDVLQRVL
ncbi:uncharacterized protein LOC126734523 isoform X2 [Anthonomus grandis grandis]|nr:uncharacterized protein LOC126734523 isoform X2 [Anthonomus grandis grandis]XP_050294153.1 uncharacterized protein LOC126734523 isoform X2 [Anthonomus grandis grandis]